MPSKPKRKLRDKVSPAALAKLEESKPARNKAPTGGRKALVIEPRDIHQIEQYAAIGLRVSEISALLGISERTFARWRQLPEVLAAYEKGKSGGLAAVGKSLFEKASGGDVTAQIWYEKTRGRRTDRVEVVADDQSQAISRLIGSMTAEQLQRVANGESPAQVMGTDA